MASELKIWISGSIARDFIMDFPGRFVDHIAPEKIHVLSVGFTVKDLRQNFGGTGPNIAYNLIMLGERPSLLGIIGHSDKEFPAYLRRLRIETAYLQYSRRKKTAAAHIITDRDDNQITGFYPGAVNESLSMPRGARAGDWAIIAAENPKNMARLAKYYSSKKIKYIFDPGQQITSLNAEELKVGVQGAAVLIGNDYEIALIASSLRGRRAEANSSLGGLLRFARKDTILVRTLGPKGSEIYAGGKKIRIGIARPRRVVDPTGAGDAYRAGFLKGLIMGYNSPRTFGPARVKSISEYLEALAGDPKARGLRTCGQLGATVASFAVEEYGTQNHKFDWNAARARYKKNFKHNLSLRGFVS